ncbi:probable serine/threonine-protein kinase mps1 isoform X2 [Cajanus cajan]|uniref:probable serine/threonine-protein kinase mps1 isoform X2 n=1 Tax=Cajanus cajan TaxID=3821 RepID=UPI0010FAE8AF|nr:probable serine/threonine-protein kinase mps1 isoform X2 [Cajanus cajan]
MDGNPNLTSSSSQEFLKQVQAALKRHRPLGAPQPHSVRPKRSMLPHRTLASGPPSISDTSSGEAFPPPESQPLAAAHKKVQFSTARTHDEASIEFNQHMKNQNVQQVESETSLISEGGKSSLLPKRTIVTQDHLHQFKNFLSQPATHSSIVGPSCPTTTSVHSTSAPMLNSITHCSHSCIDSGSHVAAEPYGNLSVNPHPIAPGAVKSPNNSLKDTNRMSIDQVASAVQACTSLVDAELTFKQSNPYKDQQGCMLKETSISKYTSCCDDMLSKGEESAAVTNIQPQAPISSSDVKLESSKLAKQDKNASSKGSSGTRKKTYDPDLFFKVNGKLYQRLGKIGSGGSSEVHKVISSDCTIYALKKIKLKGRDYATAYGFCQEIEYLNRLKGKNNIIQLIDYEVTDKALFEGVINGSFSNKDGRVRDDGYIYMVLEYGEIDLAHMLSQKWKELDGSNQTIDENWLRFYWQQILQAVNTIHEERIVHSDLKPANFLLVKGSLKLIDFGIAKAIMSDTTNIQRDSQVGTLSYMSPEAFMCNESDASGNIIKCGRSSDIWSLGCILYQMVYGRTPFSDYKTFWAKFKVITDPNHEITYEPVSNPWLVDLMKRCLAWDRNERWRIPQLLQHPFLVPRVPCPSLSRDHTLKLLHLISETCTNDPEALQLCCQLQQVLDNPIKLINTHSLNSIDQQRKLLTRISELCIQLQERLTNTDKQ